MDITQKQRSPNCFIINFLAHFHLQQPFYSLPRLKTVCLYVLKTIKIPTKDILWSILFVRKVKIPRQNTSFGLFCMKFFYDIFAVFFFVREYVLKMFESMERYNNEVEWAYHIHSEIEWSYTHFTFLARAQTTIKVCSKVQKNQILDSTSLAICIMCAPFYISIILFINEWMERQFTSSITTFYHFSLVLPINNLFFTNKTLHKLGAIKC